ncbi:solute carrier family 35 member F2-like [Etheostoma cragini]|uniref:solute carrier family 35 member F2-like n=1 Tax=Etheostoma cragini TaxID=417921 RepID=UPI00155F2718|nr:solute carrier family 35 member F2-like [Etheostoma cragini]
MATEQPEDVSADVSGDASHESRGLVDRIRKFNPKEVFTWQVAKTLAMGQGLAALICGTAISSQYLATVFQVNTPMMQSFFNYTLLCATYTPMLLCRTGDDNILQILKKRGWKYLLLGLVDVEANYAVVKAYQYTTLTSIQFVSSASNILLGDGLVLLSASLYAVSNVCQEYTVKNLSRVEFLGMVGLVGTIICTIQMVILERHEVSTIQWSWQIGLLFSAYALCMYALYSCMPVVVKLSSATSVNLSLLTADLFSLFCGIFLFQYNFSGLYLVSLVVVLIGFIAFNAVPTPTDHAGPPTSTPTCEEGCDNPAEDHVDDVTPKEVVVFIISEEERRGGGGREEEEEEKKRTKAKKTRASGPPTRE